MKPLVVLLVSFALCCLFDLSSGEVNFRLAGRIAMAVMLAFTAIGHFKFREGMSGMIPRFVPGKKTLVLLSGILEIAVAAGLVIGPLSYDAGWIAIAMFVLFLPLNIYAALRRVDYERGTSDGPGPPYLFFRIPLQVLFIVWTYLSAIK